MKNPTITIYETETGLRLRSRKPGIAGCDGCQLPLKERSATPFFIFDALKTRFSGYFQPLPATLICRCMVGLARVRNITGKKISQAACFSRKTSKYCEPVLDAQ
jgi:hypothetical protein